jgi:8-oxo-dGTP pyrophosphatase MutT (NUDIX family)
MQIRAKSVVIFQSLNRFLFTVCHEQFNNQVFYIPVGGGVEPGEYSIDAAKREVLEEIGNEVENMKLLDISENIFNYNGKDEHEIVFVYKADFKNKLTYDSIPIGNLNENGTKIKLTWATIDQIQVQQIKIYPPSLWKTLEQLTRSEKKARTANKVLKKNFSVTDSLRFNSVKKR